jgi:AraC-like DNA-binding protein
LRVRAEGRYHLSRANGHLAAHNKNDSAGSSQGAAVSNQCGEDRMRNIRTGEIEHVRSASNGTIDHRSARRADPSDSCPHPFLFGCGKWRVAAELKEGTATIVPNAEASRGLLEHVYTNGRRAPAVVTSRGGLSGWQRKKLADFIEEHLAEELRLAALADLVSLSPYHFARAFRQSFGLPPHRYHNARRMERAKALLADPANSVTAIARGLGFAETSSFSAAFRKNTGASPRDYRRGLG